jgi:hypothetical protein
MTEGPEREGLRWQIRHLPARTELVVWWKGVFFPVWSVVLEEPWRFEGVMNT